VATNLSSRLDRFLSGEIPDSTRVAFLGVPPVLGMDGD